MPEPPPRRFAVEMSSAQAAHLRSEGAWANESGLLAEYLAAIDEIDFRLRVEPHEWGESREYLPFMRMQLRCGFSRMVTVHYGVAEDEDRVLVKEFRINRRCTSRPPT